jgi:glycosyltransferase involved in cell wall biosynthesis
MAERPTVSVVVPFTGTNEQLEDLADRLLQLPRSQGDELIIVDNRPEAEAGATKLPQGQLADNAISYRHASAIRSPGHARNAGARLAEGEWLLFIDADTEPAADLLDAYFQPAPKASTAVLAGSITDVAVNRTLAARYVCARHRTDQAITLQRAGQPYAQTANCAVKREAFKQVGGFTEEIRTGEDADLCFRLARAGWELEERRGAVVRHRSRETLRALLTQVARHGAGAAWLNDRYAGEFPPPRPRVVVRRGAHYLRRTASAIRRGEREEALFALIELASLYAFDLGRGLSNRAR